VASVLDPDRGVTYRWDTDLADWVQIPVQIDERVVMDFGDQPNFNRSAGVTGTICGDNDPIGVTTLPPADADTWVDATIDDNDEIVFFARDAGPQAPSGTPPPAGTVGGVGRELALFYPDGSRPGCVYVFCGTAGSDPLAGVDHTIYNSVLAAGNYKDDYPRANGPNPESSTVVTNNYTMTFRDR
jgi:hypothetical protein